MRACRPLFSLEPPAKVGGDEMLNEMSAFSRYQTPRQGRETPSQSTHRSLSLAMKTECENCGRALPADSPNARICSFEETWCASCAHAFGNHCPGCNGVLEKRPARPAPAQRFLRRAELSPQPGGQRRGGIL